MHLQTTLQTLTSNPFISRSGITTLPVSFANRAKFKRMAEFVVDYSNERILNSHDEKIVACQGYLYFDWTELGRWTSTMSVANDNSKRINKPKLASTKDSKTPNLSHPQHHAP
jgi:hypothetical protein